MLKSFTWILIALTQCLLHLVVPGGAADPIQMSYPIGTNCFKDVPKTNVTETQLKLADIREMCDDISEPEDRGTCCYKFCLLDVSNVIDVTFVEDLESNPNATGHFNNILPKSAAYRLLQLHSGIEGNYDEKTDSYSFGDEATDKAFGIISNQLDKCASVGYYYGGREEDEFCWEMSPEQRAPIDKLVDCFDDAMVGNAKDCQFMSCMYMIFEAEKVSQCLDITFV